MMSYGQMEVTVSTKKLLDRLKENQRKHKTEHEAAIKLWREDLQNILAKVDTSGLNIFPQELKEAQKDTPVSFAKEYERAIDMFTMSTNDKVTISQDMFNQYCRDEWGWRDQFVSNKYAALSGAI